MFHTNLTNVDLIISFQNGCFPISSLQMLMQFHQKATQPRLVVGLRFLFGQFLHYMITKLICSYNSDQ